MKQSTFTPFVITATAIVVIGLIALAPMPRNIYSYAVRSTMDMGHFFAFGLLVIFCLAVLRTHTSDKLAYLIAIVFTSSLVLLIELIQPWFGRTAALGDVLTSYLGIITCISIYHVWRNPFKKRWLKWGHIIVVACIVIAIASPAITAWYSIFWRIQQGPMLGNFEKNVELQFWRPNQVGKNAARITLSDDVAYTGYHSLKIMAGNTRWSGVTYYAENENWQPYRTLSFHIYNPGEKLTVSMRIDDNGDTEHYTGRFNKSFVVQQGWQKISIPIEEIAHGPKKRIMNMRAITQVLFFISINNKTRIFYLDNVHLE